MNDNKGDKDQPESDPIGTGHRLSDHWVGGVGGGQALRVSFMKIFLKTSDK